MRALGKLAGMALLAAALTGCSLLHPKSAQQAQAPPLKTGEGSIEQQQKKDHQPPPPSTLPQPSAQTTPPVLPPAKHPRVKRPKRPKPSDKTQAPVETQQAVNPPPAASPIGQLTAGDSATEAQNRRDTLDLISKTDQGLGGIKRKLSSEEEATVVQIRTFLKQAQQALDNGDSDGAHTLATKAKLLLDELGKQ